jgi:hypothetical protein
MEATVLSLPLQLGSPAVGITGSRFLYPTHLVFIICLCNYLDIYGFKFAKYQRYVSPHFLPSVACGLYYKAFYDCN